MDYPVVMCKWFVFYLASAQVEATGTVTPHSGRSISIVDNRSISVTCSSSELSTSSSAAAAAEPGNCRC